MTRANFFLTLILGIFFLISSAPFIATYAAKQITCVPYDKFDPLRGYNKAMLSWDIALDKVAFSPAAEAYKALVPVTIREGVSNFFSNLATPYYAINYLLQGKINESLDSMGRFVINSVFGVFGLFDVASGAGNEDNPTGFGDTLEAWGAGPGVFFVMPILGPTTTRGALGTGVQLFTPLNPSNHIHVTRELWYRVVYGVSIRASQPDIYGLLKTSLNPYETIKSTIYQQNCPSNDSFLLD